MRPDPDDDGPGEGIGAAALARIADAHQRVQLARRFHNDAVTDAARVHGKTVVRLFRLAGHTETPPHGGDGRRPGPAG